MYMYILAPMSIVNGITHTFTHAYLYGSLGSAMRTTLVARKVLVAAHNLSCAQSWMRTILDARSLGCAQSWLCASHLPPTSKQTEVCTNIKRYVYIYIYIWSHGGTKKNKNKGSQKE